MIRHTVAFRLKHPAGSPSEAAFLTAGLVLREIPGVKRHSKLTPYRLPKLTPVEAR